MTSAAEPAASTGVTPAGFRLRRAGWSDATLRRLAHEQQREVQSRYLDIDADWPELEAAEVLDALLVERRSDSTGVACGVLVPYLDLVEAKRIYVVPSARGTGLGRVVLDGLEQLARAAGFRRMVLATGPRQHEAIGLYQSSGWAQIVNYGEFEGQTGPLSFGKDLGTCTTAASEGFAGDVDAPDRAQGVADLADGGAKGQSGLQRRQDVVDSPGGGRDRVQG